MATLAEELRKKQKASEGANGRDEQKLTLSSKQPQQGQGGGGRPVFGLSGDPTTERWEISPDEKKKLEEQDRKDQNNWSGKGTAVSTDPKDVQRQIDEEEERKRKELAKKTGGEQFVRDAGEGVRNTMQGYKDRMQPVEARQVSAGVDGMQASQAAFAEAIKAQQIQGTSYDPTLAGRTQIGQATTFQGASIDPSQQSQFRAQQEALGAQIQNAPSTAEAQGKLAQEDAIKRAMSQAASARGGNIALAQRAGQQLLAEESAKIAGQTQLAAAQELSQRRQLLAQIAQQGREQDLQLATQQAQLAQQAGIQAAELGTKVTLSQAELDQARELTNAALATDASKWTAQSSFEAAKANQDASLKADIQTALNNIDVSKFNANAQNQMEQFKADANLRANIANQAADLQAKGMNLDAISKQMGVEIDALKSLLGASTAVFQTKMPQVIAEDDRKAREKAGVIGAVATGVASIFS